MSQRISKEQKELALEAIREHGTMKAGAAIAGVTVRTLNLEMQRSAVFRKRVMEAREEGHRNVADKAIELIKDYAYGNYEKTDRNRLTAAIALANAYEAGFRGVTTVQGKVEHDVRVLTAVPRPRYDEIEAPKVKVIEDKKGKDDNKRKLRELNAGEPIKGVFVEVSEESKE